MPEETLGDVVETEVRKISNSSSASEVKTKDGVSCPLTILLNILMERGMLDIKKNFMAPFYGWGSTASRLKPL